MSDQNPHSPNYDPKGGAGPDGVGQGSEFVADLFELYESGLVRLPAVAGVYEKAANGLHGPRGDLASIGSRLPAGADLSALLNVFETLQDAYAATATNVQAAGDALVRIADDYARTDSATAEQFNKKLDQARDNIADGGPLARIHTVVVGGERYSLGNPPPPVTDPHRSSDPQPPPPHPGVVGDDDTPPPLSKRGSEGNPIPINPNDPDSEPYTPPEVDAFAPDPDAPDVDVETEPTQ